MEKLANRSLHLIPAEDIEAPIISSLGEGMSTKGGEGLGREWKKEQLPDLTWSYKIVGERQARFLQIQRNSLWGTRSLISFHMAYDQEGGLTPYRIQASIEDPGTYSGYSPRIGSYRVRKNFSLIYHSTPSENPRALPLVQIIREEQIRPDTSTDFPQETVRTADTPESLIGEVQNLLHSNSSFSHVDAMSLLAFHANPNNFTRDVWKSIVNPLSPQHKRSREP